MASIELDMDFPGDNIYRVTWEAVGNSDTANPLLAQKLSGAIASVQVTGTFDSATVTLAGSNDGTNWVTLKDMSGDAISLTAAGLIDFSSASLYLAPQFSGGGGSQDIDVILVLRG